VSTSESRAAARPGDLAVTAERCAAQLLGGDPARGAEEVAGRLLAIQAQDLRGARLTVRARSAGLSASDVDAALSRRRSLIVTWLNRGTLHLVRAEDYWWLHPLTTPQLRTGNSRRLAQQGVPPQDAERAVAAIRAAVAAGGRAVPAVRAGRRPGRGDLEHRGRPGRARTVRAAGHPDPSCAGRRRRRRDAVPRPLGPPGRLPRLAGAGADRATRQADAVRLRSRMAAGPSPTGPAVPAAPNSAGYRPENKAAALRAISPAGTSSMCWLIIHCWPDGSRSRPPRSP